jgi:pimeloyl-ACP methyl ester carboxylesterase
VPVLGRGYGEEMASVRKVGFIALLAGVLAALIVPMVVPISSSGTKSYQEVAPQGSTFIQIDSLRVHYEFIRHQGDQTNPPLFVLLHGFGASTYSWREVIEPFSQLGDVVAYDRPAFGFTERPTTWEGLSPYSSDAQITLLTSVIETFSVDNQPVVLVGHSAGGTLAAEYGLRNPTVVSGLLLVAPAVLTTGGGPGWLSWLFVIPQVDRLGPLLVAEIATSGDELLERSWSDVSLLTPEIRENYRRPLEIENWERAFWEFQKAPRNFLVTDNLGDLSVPVVIITGDDDRVVATEDSVELALLIPGSALEIIPHSGHLPHEETPLQFMDRVKRVLPDLLP